MELDVPKNYERLADNYSESKPEKKVKLVKSKEIDISKEKQEILDLAGRIEETLDVLHKKNPNKYIYDTKTLVYEIQKIMRLKLN